MASFAPYFELRARDDARPAVASGKFIAVVEPLLTDVDADLLSLLGEDHVVVLQAPEHLQPPELTGRNAGQGRGAQRAFTGVAFLRAMPPEDEADAELIVPLFSHN